MYAQHAPHGSAQIIDHHGGTAASQLDRVQPAKSATGSGDDDDLPGEVDHGTPSVDSVSTTHREHAG
jgi:hypothetical protein